MSGGGMNGSLSPFWSEVDISRMNPNFLSPMSSSIPSNGSPGCPPPPSFWPPFLFRPRFLRRRPPSESSSSSAEPAAVVGDVVAGGDGLGLARPAAPLRRGVLRGAVGLAVAASGGGRLGGLGLFARPALGRLGRVVGLLGRPAGAVGRRQVDHLGPGARAARGGLGVGRVLGGAPLRVFDRRARLVCHEWDGCAKRGAGDQRGGGRAAAGPHQAGGLAGRASAPEGGGRPQRAGGRGAACRGPLPVGRSAQTGRCNYRAGGRYVRCASLRCDGVTSSPGTPARVGRVRGGASV